MSETEILTLEREYTCRYGTPVIDGVDPAIFRRTYFTHCMQCTFCHDSCCQYGVDVDFENKKRLELHSDELSRFTGIPRERWFSGEIAYDKEVPGGGSDRTAVDERGCVFLAKPGQGRGCMIHRYCVEKGIDYHELKPMISILFPLTYDGGHLVPAEEIEDGSLQCIDQGPTLYQGLRDELRYYFGDALVAELDRLAETHGRAPAVAAKRGDTVSAV